MLKYQKFKHKSRITIDGELTIYNVLDIKQELIAALADERDIEVNLSKISEIDTAGMQLLLWFAKLRIVKGFDITFVDSEGEVIDTAESIGLDLNAMGKPAAEIVERKH